MADTERAALCARIDELCVANERMRELVRNMWPVFIGIKRATFADRVHVAHEIDELGIEVRIDG